MQLNSPLKRSAFMLAVCGLAGAAGLCLVVISGMNSTWVVIPMLFAAGVSCEVLFWRLSERRKRRTDRGLCPACGYNRAGLPLEAACPECGVGGTRTTT